MQTLKSAFNVPVGFSDHTKGDEITIAAVAIGARIIEKHFTIDKSMPGPDHSSSLDPKELLDLIRKIRNIESALGDGIKQPQPSELNTREVARKSIVAARDLTSGEVITRDSVSLKRPGTGLSAHEFRYIMGREIKANIKKDEIITLDMF